MKKILFASQYKILLQRYSNLLTNWGFDVHTTTSGLEALRLHKEHHFDLIVSDFELEELSMSTFFSLLHKEKKSHHVPIIIACHNIPNRIERAQRIGASAVILKPIDRIKLLEIIGNHFGLNLIRGKRVKIEVCVTINKDGQEFICVSRDLSDTGILLKSDYAFQIGDRITCKFTLPHSCQIEVAGEVVRYMTDLKCDNLYGVKFIAITAVHLQAIKDFINPSARKHADPKSVKPGRALLNKK
jgi:CheY-like chemotaxis protein